MQQSRILTIRLIFIFGLLSMLMPLAIDMSLPSLPSIGQEFGVDAGYVQFTLSSYILGFAIGQIFYGPIADSLGRKPVIVWGTLIFSMASVACALTTSIDQLIYVRFLHGLVAAAVSVVINTMMRDMFNKEEFSRMSSFVTLVMVVAPLVAPILGGAMLLLFTWHSIFWSIAAAAFLGTLLVVLYIKETLPKERQQSFHPQVILRNFASLFRHKKVLCYMLTSAFSFAGMFSFLSAGSFVYIDLHGVSPQDFGYYFSINIVFLFIMTMVNGRYVRRFGAITMLRVGLLIQLVSGILMLFFNWIGLGFWSLVLGVATYIGCISIISANAMAVILDDFPHMAGTVSSLAGALRFGIAGVVGTLLAVMTVNSEYPMVLSMSLCAIIAAVLFFYADSLPNQGSC